MKEKIDMAKAIIRDAFAGGSRPAVLCSFGKDSMVLLHLVREVGHHEKLSTHGYPLPVIYWRDPWFPHKHEFAEKIARSWALEVHNFLPVATGVKAKGHSGSESGRLELVARYSLGFGYIDIPKNTAAPEEYPRRDYLCGLRDWILRPKAAALSFPFEVLLHGHKSSDVDPFEGAVPLRADREQLNDRITAFFPLRNWTDDDVWNYIEKHHVPLPPARYKGRAENPDHWHDNDTIHACTACIDPRNDAEKVFCPKLQELVPNVGSKVMQLNERPDYVLREEPQLSEVN
jgi:3'-phosphoadenosine 5'-phosphosulfate sulfotransferase (PAPS reductase)/FAD synthetase